MNSARYECVIGVRCKASCVLARFRYEFVRKGASGTLAHAFSSLLVLAAGSARIAVASREGRIDGCLQKINRYKWFLVHSYDCESRIGVLGLSIKFFSAESG